MELKGANHKIVFKSPDPQNIYAYSPSIIAHCGAVVVTMDVGGSDISSLEKSIRNKKEYRGRIYILEEKSQEFKFVDTFCFKHARIFADGGTLYIIGQRKDLMIIRSDDGGYTWSEAVSLTKGETYHGAPTNVLEHNGYIYMSFEKMIYNDVDGWPVSVLAPVLIKAKKGTDLTKSENWFFSKSKCFRDIVGQEQLDFCGIPFFNTPEQKSLIINGRDCAPLGWLETNVVKIYDKNHYWYEENTFHLFMRAHTGGTNFCTVMKVVEGADGSMDTCFVTVPSGKKALFVPMPGGQMKFHILYDELTKLYWLLSTQATDSMTKCEKLSAERYNLPNNQRSRLQLLFSKNMVDWCFGCMVDIGKTEKQSRHYAAMEFDGDDIIIASRSGDQDSCCAHNCNLILFHRIKNFRNLVY